MQKSTQIFDSSLLSKRRERVANNGTVANFLHEHAAHSIQERLKEINRSFTMPAFVGWNVTPWKNVVGSDAKIVSDADILDLEPNTYDLIINGLTLHCANDPVGQLIQMRNALKPDGLMISVLFGGQSLNELRSSLAEAEIQTKGGISPRVSPMAEVRELGGLLQRAGFALPVVDNMNLNIEYGTVIQLLHDIRAMAETNVMRQQRKSLSQTTLNKAIEIYTKNFATTKGRVTATVEMIFLTGWAPSSNQQKPLKPGSAQKRIADVLGAKEYKL